MMTPITVIHNILLLNRGSWREIVLQLAVGPPGPDVLRWGRQGLSKEYGKKISNWSSLVKSVSE